MSAEEERLPQHRKNQLLEELIGELNNLLGPVESALMERFHRPKYPTVFVVGAPRSGTTLSVQWLASTNCFGYFTNLLSRFASAPYIGAKIQQLLTNPEYDFNNELFDIKPEATFDSVLGKTKGALSPSEFFYLWRRFCPNQEIAPIAAGDENLFDGEGLAAEFAAIESVFAKPLAMKGMILQYNIPLLAAYFDYPIFFYVKRLPYYNIQSLVGARRRYFGSLEPWYSAKPPEYEELLHKSPYHQVAGQVHFTNVAIERGLAELSDENYLCVQYEDLCRDPAAIYNELANRFKRLGHDLTQPYEGPEEFENTNSVTADEEECVAICQAYSDICGFKIAP